MKHKQVFAVYYLLHRSNEGRSLELLHLKRENCKFLTVKRAGYERDLQARGQRLLQLLSLLLVSDLQGVQEPRAPYLGHRNEQLKFLTCHAKQTLNLTLSAFFLIFTLLASFLLAFRRKSLISLISRGIF